jgi:cation diffusion facilitator CzcD-associated flavoprotein CzcO
MKGRSPDLRIAIIGAGVAGLSAAQRLKDLGYRDITIYEK